MNAEQLWNQLYGEYNAIYFHNMKHGCAFNDECPDRPKMRNPCGYAELKRDQVFVTLQGRIEIKKGTTIRITKASNMGDLCGTRDLDQQIGYEFRNIDPCDAGLLENCRLIREIEPDHIYVLSYVEEVGPGAVKVFGTPEKLLKHFLEKTENELDKSEQEEIIKKMKNGEVVDLCGYHEAQRKEVE